jgi:ATP-dependent helicase HrpB
MNKAALDAIVKNLRYPVARNADGIADLLQKYAVCGISGEAGSGKSTVVPLIASAHFHQRIIVVQPRRLAAIAVCRRLNELCESAAGRIAGFAVRQERDERKTDHILCVTTGVFLRMIAEHPSLDGIAMVILDEIHERSLESDLCWVLAKSSLDLYRADLKLVVMSASVGEELLAEAGIEGFGWMTVEGRLFPVEIEYRAVGSYTDEIAHCAAGVTAVLERTAGDMLVFLPGEKEIRRVHELLSTLERQGFFIHELFGKMNPQEQKRVLEKTGAGRRIILATNIAQTSLTIEGVTAVVDTGLEKSVRQYPGEAASSLVTQRISAAAAQQRTGRAGRLGPGLCLRLWDERDKLAGQDVPALFREDNARAVLELARWGDFRSERYQWLSPPDPGFYRTAVSFLQKIQVLDAEARLTEKGAVCAGSSLPPAFASAVFDSGSPLQKTSLLLAALLLEERSPKYSVNDFALLSPASVVKDTRLSMAADKEARIFGFTLTESPQSEFDIDALVRNFASGIGIRDRDTTYKLAGGPALRLLSADHAPEALAVLRGDHKTATGIIYQYISLDGDLLRPVLKAAAQIEEELFFDRERGAFSAVKKELFGALSISETRIAVERLLHFADDFYRLLEKESPGILPWDDRARLLKERIACLKAAEVNDAHLVQAIREFYGDALTGPAQVRMADVLLSMVKPGLRKQVSELDEKRFRLENGRFARIRYEKDGRIVVSARLQDFFGMTKNPVVAGVTAAAELLSPAGRPVQITSDLDGFWKTSYQSVRKEMAGRYPKHKWPIDPLAKGE